MRKWDVSRLFFFRLSALATRVNTLIVGLVIFSLLGATLVTKYLTEQSTKLAARQTINSASHTILPIKASVILPAQKAFISPTPPLKHRVKDCTKSPNQKASKSITPPPVPKWNSTKSLLIPSRQPRKENSEVVYNLKTPPKFRKSQELQTIVKDVVDLAEAKNLPKNRLSMTLIDAKTGETAGYKENIPRYPASVVKMFWMVFAYAQIESGIWSKEEDFNPYIAKMIQESDNAAASFILDLVTGTQSESELSQVKFKIWKHKRQQVNRFFQKAGFKGINISQKTFPVYYINLPEPDGSEAQFLGNPIRNWNKITTKQAARLIYEICYTEQAVSLAASKKMCRWLKRDLNPKAWRKESIDDEGFNPVRTFFGASLAKTNVKFYSKAGWTSSSRTEAAMVDSEKNKATYILSIFAHSSKYADDVTIFPQMSRLVYKRMTARGSKSKLNLNELEVSTRKWASGWGSQIKQVYKSNLDKQASSVHTISNCQPQQHSRDSKE